VWHSFELFEQITKAIRKRRRLAGLIVCLQAVAQLAQPQPSAMYRKPSRPSASREFRFHPATIVKGATGSVVIDREPVHPRPLVWPADYREGLAGGDQSPVAPLVWPADYREGLAGGRSVPVAKSTTLHRGRFRTRGVFLSEFQSRDNAGALRMKPRRWSIARGALSLRTPNITKKTAVVLTDQEDIADDRISAAGRCPRWISIHSIANNRLDRPGAGLYRSDLGSARVTLAQAWRRRRRATVFR